MDDDGKLVNLSARRNAKKHVERKQRALGWVPSYTVTVWLVFLAFAVVTYFAFGRS